MSALELDSEPLIYLTTGADPSPGNEWSIAVPGHVNWRILALHFRLIASATAANRRPSVQFLEGGNIYWHLTTGVTQTAGQSFFYSLATGYGAVVQDLPGGLHTQPFPGFTVIGGSVIESTTVGLQVDDNYSPPSLVVEERRRTGGVQNIGQSTLADPRIAELALGG